MAPVLVHRIEHTRLRNRDNAALAKGPFQMRNFIWTLDARRMPTPYQDGLKKWHANDVCAFANPEKLHRWFSEKDRARLQRAGFKVRAFLVPPPYVKWGEEQVMFDYTRRIR